MTTDFAKATYCVEGAQTGANNRDMLVLFNPLLSERIIHLSEVWATVPASSGATVIIPFEIRKCIILPVGGTILTPRAFDSTNPVSVVDARTNAIVVDTGLYYTFVEQINTSQGSTKAHTEEIHTANIYSQLQPIVIRPGEGVFLRQIASNTSVFRMGALWTEESEI